MPDETRQHALSEIRYCETVLAKGGLTILSDLFAGVSSITAWDHYPPGDVYDPASNSQYFYHCHPAEEGAAEHGHFHCFVRPKGLNGPIHHLVAIGVNTEGQLLRLFTVNQWVVGDDWADAQTIFSLLGRFDMQMPRPSYLVNRWLTAIIVAYETEITQLLHQRDRVLAAHKPASGTLSLEDCTLEVLSEFIVPITPKP
jgi:hypothetical protein